MTGVAESRPRVLVVAYCFPPHAAIGTHRTLRLVSHLADRGWQVDVLTARPRAYLPNTPIDESLLARVPGSVRIVRSGALRGFTKLGRLLEPLKALRRPARRRRRGGVSDRGPAGGAGTESARRGTVRTPRQGRGLADARADPALPAFATRRPDVIVSSAPPWTTHLVAGCLASAFGRPWVADFRDPWVRSPWTRYRTRPGLAIARRLEAATVMESGGGGLHDRRRTSGVRRSLRAGSRGEALRGDERLRPDRARPAGAGPQRRPVRAAARGDALRRPQPRAPAPRPGRPAPYLRTSGGPPASAVSGVDEFSGRRSPGPVRRTGSAERGPVPPSRRSRRQPPGNATVRPAC